MGTQIVAVELHGDGENWLLGQWLRCANMWLIFWLDRDLPMVESAAVTAWRVVPPGDILQRELKARALTPTEFAIKAALNVETVKRILRAEIQIDAELAQALGAALGTSAQLWLALEKHYRDGRREEDSAIGQVTPRTLDK